MARLYEPTGQLLAVHGFAALEREGPLAPFDLEQREPRPDGR